MLGALLDFTCVDASNPHNPARQVPLLFHFTEAERSSNLAHGRTAGKWLSWDGTQWLQSLVSLSHVFSHVTGLLPSMVLWGQRVHKFPGDRSYVPPPPTAESLACPRQSWWWEVSHRGGRSWLPWGRRWRKTLEVSADNLVGRKLPSCSCKVDVPSTQLLKNKTTTKPTQESCGESYFIHLF